MRVAYFSIDEVNLSIARHLADLLDAIVDPIASKDKDPLRHADAVLYDLDSLTPCERRRTLASLAASRHCLPAAVHSYNLEEAQVLHLLARGIAVYRRLESQVFSHLREAVRRARSMVEMDLSELEQDQPAA